MKFKVSFLLLLFASECWAWDPIGDLVTPDRIIRNVSREIENANRDVERVKSESDSQAKIIEAQEAKAKQDEEAVNELLELSKKLDEGRIELIKQKEELVEEKKKLEKSKAELEQRESFYATGFFSALFTTLLAGFGLVVKFPTMRLERELLKLQIQEKERSINGAGANNGV